MSLNIKRGRPDEGLSDSILFHLGKRLKAEFAEVCWQDRVTVACKLRDLMQEEVNRKKSEGSTTPHTNIRYGHANKYIYSGELTFSALFHRVGIAQEIEEAVDIQQQAIKIRKMANRLDKTAGRKIGELHSKGRRELNWYDRQREVGLSDKDIRDVIAVAKEKDGFEGFD